MKLEFPHKEGWASHNHLRAVEEDGIWSYTGFVSKGDEGRSFDSKSSYESEYKALTEGLRWMLEYHKDSKSDMSLSVSLQLKNKLQSLQQPTLF